MIELQLHWKAGLQLKLLKFSKFNWSNCIALINVINHIFITLITPINGNINAYLEKNEINLGVYEIYLFNNSVSLTNNIILSLKTTIRITFYNHYLFKCAVVGTPFWSDELICSDTIKMHNRSDDAGTDFCQIFVCWLRK